MYPIAFSVENFFSTINEYGIENVLQWNHAVKLQRMIDLLHFCRQNNLNTSVDVQHFLLTYSNQILFLSINGIGYKTLDYLLKLMNIETVAVDRHIYSFVEKAGIISKDYLFVKTVVEYAADLMGVSRRSIDYSIWSYMSNESSSKSKQLSLCF
jgi:thermostable 8-oxoguanine DNA glycosylase